jgi:hypothetical protein
MTRDEDRCYICGDSRPRPNVAVRNRPVSALTNLVFLASLTFTGYCFFAQHKLSLPMTLAISASLLLIRIVAEKAVNRNPD